MIIEYIRYDLKTHTPDEFLTAYQRASTALDSTPECLGYDISQCAEAANVFILRIDWTSADGHLKGFRGSANFRPFLQEIRPFMGEIAEMRHYQPTAIGKEKS